jgi:hypothetical protein
MGAEETGLLQARKQLLWMRKKELRYAMINPPLLVQEREKKRFKEEHQYCIHHPPLMTQSNFWV